MRNGRIDGFPHLQYINFLSLSDKELVILSPIITVLTLRQKTEMKTVSFLTRLTLRCPIRLPSTLVPRCSQPELAK